MRGLRRTAASLTAVLVLVLLSGSAASAAVGPAVPGEVDVSRLRASCSGDTVRVVADLAAPAAAQVAVQLLVQDGPGGFRPLGAARWVAVPAGSSQLSIDLPGGSAAAKAYRVQVVSAGRTSTSPPVQVGRCAPAAVVAEVPAALLVPLTLVMTGGLVVGLRRRRA